MGDILNAAHLVGVIARLMAALPGTPDECAEGELEVLAMDFCYREAAAVIGLLPAELVRAIADRAPLVIDAGAEDPELDVEAEAEARRAEDSRIADALGGIAPARR